MYTNLHIPFVCLFLLGRLGNVQDLGKGDDQERGEKEADLETETGLDAEVALAPGEGEGVAPEIERVEGTTEVDRERESDQALERSGGHVREMLEGDHDLEIGREVVQEIGDDRDLGTERGRDHHLGTERGKDHLLGTERGRGHHLGTGSTEGEAILEKENNSNSFVTLFFFFFPHNYYYTFNNYCTHSSL